MKRLRTLFSFAAVAAATSAFFTPAQASGDYMSCSPDMKVFVDDFTGCDSRGILAPGNDTRINLVFLLADAKGQKLQTFPGKPDDYPVHNLFIPQDWPGFASALMPPSASGGDGGSTFAYGEGTICVSDADGREAFAQALAADASIPAGERDALKAAREGVTCTDTADAATPSAAPAVQSPSGQAFAAYLAAAKEFYQGNRFNDSGFAALGSSSQPWVREASRYMVARVALLAAGATAFTDYGTLDQAQVDKTKLAAARDALNAYLKDYPQGAYATSAAGLLRRAAWLGADADAQIAAYQALLDKAEVNAASIMAINEIDLKLPEEAYTKSSANPVMLAVQDLRAMRPGQDDKGNKLPGIPSADLEAQRPRFAGQEALFDYLLAAHAWFGGQDADAVLKLIPETTGAGDFSYLEFSRQLMRVAALDAKRDPKARDALLALFPRATQAYQRAALEMALAMSDERARKIARVFDQDSKIQSPEIRQHVLEHLAGPILLRQQAEAKTVPQAERETAIYHLLARDLLQGRFKGFLDDITLLPPKPAPDADGNVDDKFDAFRWAGSTTGYVCPDLVGTAKRLAGNPKDIQGRLCLGDFFRATGLVAPDTPAKDELGGTGTLFAGAVLSRQDFYKEIMASKKASHAEKAYALYRAVKCYEPSHINDCGGTDVKLSQRKAWYNQLKAGYGDTEWAKELRYYW